MTNDHTEKQLIEWDFFIAHASADRGPAEALYELLKPAKVFLDTKSLLLGDEWDRELPLAQSRSRITVVLVSSNTDQAYYESEEIASAIILGRQDKSKHRVVPVFLDDRPDETKVPYGLLRKHGVYVSREGGLEAVSIKLKELL